MSFLTDWKDAITGFGGAIGHGFGAIYDWATLTDNGYNAVTGRPNPSESDKMLLDLSKSFNGMYKGLGPIGKGAGWLMKKDYELYSDYVSRPLSTFITADSLADSPTFKREQGTNRVTALFDGDTWSRAWQIAQHRSPGQALILSGTGDILDQHKVEDWERAWWFNLLSGSTDAFLSIRLDPLGAAGKLVKRTGVLRTSKKLPTTLTEMGASKEVRAATAAHELAQKAGTVGPDVAPPSGIQALVERKTPMVRTLDWMQQVSDKARNRGEAARKIEKHPILAETPHSALIASMMADSTRSQKDLIMRIAMGDGSAFHALDAERADLAARMKTLADMRDDLIKAEATGYTASGKAFDPARLAAVRKEIASLDRRDRWLDNLIKQENSTEPGILSSVGIRPKGLGYDKIATAGATARGTISAFAARGNARETWRYYNQFNMPVRVVAALGMTSIGKASHFVNGVRPRGWLDPNDPEGWRELDHMLSRVKGFSLDRRNKIVGNYMAATGEADKLRIATNAEREAIAHVMHKIGLSADDANSVVNEHLAERDRALAGLRNRAYSATKTLNENGVPERIDLQYVDPENIPTAIMPVLATQLADKIPLADMDTLQKAAFRHRNNLVGYFAAKAGPVKDLGIGLSDIFSSAWKTASLLRMGYMIRVISDDELAYIAKIGAMAALRPVGAGAANWVYNRWATNVVRVQRASMRARAGFKTRDLELPEKPAKRRIGQGSQDVTIGGIKMTLQGVTPQTKEGAYWDDLFEGDRSNMQQDERYRLKQMRDAFAHAYGLVNRGDANYYDAWAHALNYQLGQDPLANKLLQGYPPEDALYWLTRSPEGRAHARKLPFRASDPERWVHNIDAMIEELAPTPELRKAARAGKVDKNLILKEVSAADHPDQISGALLDLNLGRGNIADQYVKFRDAWFKHANQMPTHVLVKHPLAKYLYEGRRNELIERFMSSGGQVDNVILRKLENQARFYALKEINKVVLDLSTHSNAAHTFRFIAPFYNAWDKALRRWGRLAYGDPSIIFYGNRLWQGLPNLPVVIDKNAHLEDQEGNRRTGFQGIADAANQLIVFRMPESIAKRIGGQGVVKVPKGSLNTVLQGDPWYLPGFGPFVQVPASHFLKSKPQYADMLKSMLPYGPQNTEDLITPASLRKFFNWRNNENEQYQTAMIRIWQTRMAQWMEHGKVGPPPSPDDPQIRKDARNLFALQFITQVFSPFNARFDTPYKFYIDQYHKMLSDPKIGPENARDAFAQKYPDYFFFADSVSKNVAQLPATIDAWYASKRYSKLLAQAPDVAPVILGDVALGGDFNSAVYQAQFKQRLNPASLQTARQPQSLHDFAQNSMVSAGWQKYNKVMEILRIELANRHLLSFAQAGAQDLKAAKGEIVRQIGKQNPEWYADYQSYDAEKQQNIIDQLHKVAVMKPLQARQDIQALQQYLFIRDTIIAELARRKAAKGSGSILARSNADLASAWEYERDRVAENPTFSRNVFDRYLHGDTILNAPLQ